MPLLSQVRWLAASLEIAAGLFSLPPPQSTSPEVTKRLVA